VHLSLIGDRDDVTALLALLGPGAVHLDVSRPDDEPGPLAGGPVVLSTSAVPPALALDHPWLAWNRAGSDDFAVEAYANGALAVLPSALTPEVLTRTLRTVGGRIMAHRAPADVDSRRTRIPMGESISLRDDDVLVVKRGIVATMALHEDGTEVLIGLAGRGDLVVGHPDDSCCVQLLAHSDVEVDVLSWADAVRRRDLADQLRSQLRRAQGWASVQARPRIEIRVTGLLSQMAPRFGRPHPAGTLIDVRVTHAQLAAAVGATRATITRVVGRLRARRAVTLIGSGDDQRFVLRQIEQHRH